MNGLNPLHITAFKPGKREVLLVSTMSGLTDNRHIATTDAGVSVFSLTAPFCVTSNPTQRVCTFPLTIFHVVDMGLALPHQNASQTAAR
jgi:hypothetical protein